MGIWQIILIGLYCLSLGIHAARHGQPREDKYNFWSTLLSAAITMFILFKGGFFG